MVLVKLVVMFLILDCSFPSCLFIRYHVKLDVLYNGREIDFLYTELVLVMQTCLMFGEKFNILTFCSNNIP